MFNAQKMRSKTPKLAHLSDDELLVIHTVRNKQRIYRNNQNARMRKKQTASVPPPVATPNVIEPPYQFFQDFQDL